MSQKVAVEDVKATSMLLEKLLALFKLVNRDKIQRVKESVLKNKTKRKIYELCDGKHTVTDIVSLVGTSQPNVSYHLTSLLEAGLVSYRDENGNRFYFKTLD